MGDRMYWSWNVFLLLFYTDIDVLSRASIKVTLISITERIVRMYRSGSLFEQQGVDMVPILFYHCQFYFILTCIGAELKRELDETWTKLGWRSSVKWQAWSPWCPDNVNLQWRTPHGRQLVCQRSRALTYEAVTWASHFILSHTVVFQTIVCPTIVCLP